MARARTKEEKEMARQRRKAREAKAMMDLHNAKANHAAGTLNAKQSHLHGHHHVTPVGANPSHQPVGTAAPMSGSTAAPTYPAGGYHTRNKYI